MGRVPIPYAASAIDYAMRSAAELRVHAAKLREIADSAPWDHRNELLEGLAVLAEAREAGRIAPPGKPSP
jgi:hypothetical protein